jgi:hypothetical protein
MSRDMSACLLFWGGEIPGTTPTFPAKEGTTVTQWQRDGNNSNGNGRHNGVSNSTTAM